MEICQLFKDLSDPDSMSLFENGSRSPVKQEYHTLEAAAILEKNLKSCLTGLVRHLFGDGEYFLRVTFASCM